MADGTAGDDGQGQAAGSGSGASRGGGSGRRAVRRRRRSNVSGGRAAVRTEVKLSEDEAAILVPRAEELGISLPRLLVEAALTPAGETPTERRNALTQLFALHRTLAGAANNLNQLAKHANATGIVPEAAEAQKWQILELCVRISDLVEAIGEGRLPHVAPADVEDDDKAGDEGDEWEAVDDVLTEELPDTERLRWLLTGMLMATVPATPPVDPGRDERPEGESR